jgi:putative oxidoreductase
MPVPLPKSARVVSWIARLVAAGILGMAGVMKWISSTESIRLFQDLGAEPWGRYAMGSAELVTAVLLLVPRTAFWGGLAAAGLMAGAVLAHVTRLGIVYNGDASLFAMAVTTLVAGLMVAVIHREREQRASAR